MSTGLSSRDVALWLRIQIAGRLSRTSSLAHSMRLSERLGVSPEIITQAYDLIDAGDAARAGPLANGAGRDGYRTMATLVDKIASIAARPG